MDYLITYGVTILLLTGCIWWNWNSIKLNSHSLHKQWLFWIAIIFPIYSCFYFGVIVWIEYPVEVSTKGYSDFLDISKLPLYLLAGSPILGAFVASAHRSLQTDIQIQTANKQLNESQKKNRVDLFYADSKYTIECLSSIKNTDDKGIQQPNKLFNKSHIRIKKYELEINNAFYDSLNNSIHQLVELIHKIDFSEPSKYVVREKLSIHKDNSMRKLRLLSSFNYIEISSITNAIYNQLEIKNSEILYNLESVIEQPNLNFESELASNFGMSVRKIINAVHNKTEDDVLKEKYFSSVTSLFRKEIENLYFFISEISILLLEFEALVIKKLPELQSLSIAISDISTDKKENNP